MSLSLPSHFCFEVMSSTRTRIMVLAWLLASSVHAAYLVEVHPSGLGQSSFDGDGRDSVPSKALGLTASNSFFGSLEGDDIYTIRYIPGTDGDNLTLSAGEDLGNGRVASGVPGGENGIYNIYATWPRSENVNIAGSKVSIRVQDGADLITLEKVVMNVDDPDNPGGSNAWALLGQVEMDASLTYEVVFEANASGSFVSQRLHGVLFEAQIPDDPNLKLNPSNFLNDVVLTNGKFTQAIMLENSGESETLTLASARIEGRDQGHFTLADIPSGEIPAGESRGMTLNFDAAGRGGDFEAALVFQSNDVSSPLLRVPLILTLPYPNGLVAHFAMDETEGAVLEDRSGNAFHAQLAAVDGGSFTLGSSGLATGTALTLSDGGGVGAGFAEIPAGAGFPELYSHSVAFWVRISSSDIDTVSGFFSQGTTVGDPFALVSGVTEGTSKLEYFIAGDNAGGLVSEPIIQTESTYHIAVTYEDTNGVADGADFARLYVDGKLVAENADLLGFVQPVPSSFLMGAVKSGENLFGLSGALDDLQIYDLALSTEDIAFLFANPGKSVGASDSQTNIDTDGDGLSDDEERTRFLTDPLLADTDGDGFSDGFEVRAGTDATSRASYFRVTEVANSAGGAVEVTWTSAETARYAVQFTEDLASADWQTLVSDLEGSAGNDRTSYQDTRAAGKRGFYRVMLAGPEQ